MDQFGELAEKINENEGSLKEYMHVNKIKIPEIKNKLAEQKKQLRELKNVEELSHIDSDFINEKNQEEVKNKIETCRNEEKKMNEV